MHRRVFIAFMVAFPLAAHAFGASIITGHHLLLPDTPGQIVPLLIESDVPQGFNRVALSLTVSIDGLSGPFITDIDMTSPGTVFGDAPGGNNGGSDYYAFPTRAQISEIRTLSGDTSPPEGGVLAFVEIDTTGFTTPGESWYFYLYNNAFLMPAAAFSDPSQGYATLVPGSLTIVPEPDAIVPGALAVMAMGAIAVARRRQPCRRSSVAR